MKKNHVFWLSYCPWKRSKMSECGTSQHGLVGVVVFSQRSDSMTAEVFSDLNYSRVCPRRCSIQADARAAPSGGRAVGLGVSGSRWGRGSAGARSQARR